jgi:RNA polymerase sigma factor for flagellar operon FliA
MPLVKYHAERIHSRLPDQVELDDLVSVGVFGLMDAIDAFDLSRGVKFESYATLRVRGAILDELRNMDWVPRLVRARASKIDRAIKAFELRAGRPPSDDELAAEMGLSAVGLEKMRFEADATGLCSLDKKWYETDSYKDVCEVDLLKDGKAEGPALRAAKRDLLRLVTRGLNRAERLIIILYYYEGVTMKEIGATLDLSESRVSQVHKEVVGRVRGLLDRRRAEFDLR